jgi:hypothetical protein
MAMNKYMTGAEASPKKSPVHGLNRQCFQGSRTHLAKEATRDQCMSKEIHLPFGARSIADCAFHKEGRALRKVSLVLAHPLSQYRRLKF